MCLKYLKKIVYLLVSFFKAFKKRSQRTKISRAKVTYYTMSLYFYASFLSVYKISRAKVTYYIMSPYFYTSFFKRIRISE